MGLAWAVIAFKPSMETANVERLEMFIRLHTVELYLAQALGFIGAVGSALTSQSLSNKHIASRALAAPEGGARSPMTMTK